MNDAIRMQISAFVDGELPDNEADLLLRRMNQDADLRRQVAEYMEIGRAMRGESGVSGTEKLRDRIAAAIDDKPIENAGTAPMSPSDKNIRPWLGVAVAASVALVALLGLQITPGVDSVPMNDSVADVVEDPTYTVPQPLDEQLKQYYLSHGASSSEAGANGLNARLVSLRLSEETLTEEETEDEDAVEKDAAEETPTQP